MAVRRALVGLLAAVALLTGFGAPAWAAPPAKPPTGLRATAVSASEVALSWTAASGASGYQVLRGSTSGGPYAQVGTTSGLSYSDKGLAPDTRYFYVVRSTGRRTSGNSAEVSATTPKAVPAPVNVKAVSDGTTMELTWDAVPGATRYDVIEVMLPYDDELVLGSTTGTTFVHADAVAGHWYLYKVRAVAPGATADSAESYVRVGPPTKTTLEVSPAPSELGQNVVLTADVAPVDKTLSLYSGDVEFFMDGQSVGRATIGSSAHYAIYQMYGLPVGEHVFTAQYRGDSFFDLGASASASIPLQTVPAYGGVSFGAPGVLAYGVDSFPSAAAVADVTGDGLGDVLMTTQSTADLHPDTDFRLAVFAQRPDHTFAPPQVLATHASTSRAEMRIVTGDLDGDGDTDVAVGGDTGIDVFAQVGGVLTDAKLLATPDIPVDLRVADVDADGRNDLVVSDARPETLLYRGQDSGFASPVVVSATSGGRVDVGDLDGDGRLDVVTAATWSFTVHTQTADGAFTQSAVHEVPTGGFGVGSVAVGDVTGDGRADVAATVSANDPESRLVVYPQVASGGLGAPTVYGLYDSPEPVVVADVDGDGRSDLVVAHGGWGWASVVQQRPDGMLGRAQRFRLPGQTSHYDERGLAVGDVTGDGKPDLVVADYLRGAVIVPQL